jgi:hypothetical protein
MPRTMCPLCGGITHVNTGNAVAYEQRYPELAIVGYAGRVCSQCAPELAEGDRVIVRDFESDDGHVIRVALCADGHKLYRVKLASGGTSTYPRVRLAKWHNSFT